MPQGKKLLKRKDGRYKCTYYGRVFYGKSSDEAKRKRDEYKRLVEAGMQTRQKTVAEFAAEWLPKARPPHKVTRKTYNGLARLMDMMIAVIGNNTLSEVTPLDALGVFSESFSLCRDSYIKKGLYLYRALFDAAIACRYITTNPFRDKTAQPPMKDDCQSHRAITDEERYYIETTPHRIQPVAMLMLYAGLRDSEALAIIVDRDIDFSNRVIHLRQFRHTDHNQAFVNEQGKTKKAARDIGLFPQLAECLSGRSGLVVSMKDGRILSDSAWRRGWESFVNAIERRMNGCQRRWYGKRKIDLVRIAEYDRLIASGYS